MNFKGVIMKPTQEQLNDPKWWGNYNDKATCCYWHKPTNSIWFSRLPKKDLTNLEFLAERPVFVPEVGVECEMTWGSKGSWFNCVTLTNNKVAILGDYNKIRNLSELYGVEFRPIKSERDLTIDAALEVYNCGKQSADMAGALYDAGMLQMGNDK
jgi:hypothetical protein